jgi:formamidopyrimidine-DNA glycosylase
VTLLPEVEVVRKDLEKDVVGKRFKDVTVKAAGLVAHHRNRPDFYKALQGRKIEGVGRRGTWLLFDLDDGSQLVVKMGVQGSVTRETANEEPARTTLFVATFTTGGALHYHDPGKDAEIFVLGPQEKDELGAAAPTGIDPLADQFTWHMLSQQLQSRKTKLKPLMVDETFMIGLGDLYSDEILWSAGLAGERLSSTLSSQEVRRLYRAILEVLYEAVKQRGAAEGNAVEDDPFGDVDFGEHIKVYGRDGKPCARCRQPIARSKVDKRHETYHCANCQT